MSIILDGTANTVTPLNGSLGATTPSTVVATTVVASSTIKGATTIGVGNATPSASGAGITFPATQSASTDANTLDDYEEGTWTPNQGGGLTVVGTFSSSGTYVKIGKQVSVFGMLSATTSIAYNGNGIFLSTLPFTASSNGTGGAVNNTNTAGTFLNPNGVTIYASGAMLFTPNIPFSVTYMTT